MFPKLATEIVIKSQHNANIPAHKLFEGKLGESQRQLRYMSTIRHFSANNRY